jgi:hypothetical protein
MMRISRYRAAALGAVLLTSCACMAFAQQAPAGGTYQQSVRQGRHERFLTPELRAMWHLQHRDEIKAMSPEQRHAYRQQLHQQFLAMTPAQKAKMRDQLQAQWNHLPPQRQQAIEQRLAQRQQEHRNGQLSQRGYPAQASQGGYSHE